MSCGSWDKCTTLVFSCDLSVSFTHTSGNLPEETRGQTWSAGFMVEEWRGGGGGREVSAAAGDSDGQRAPFSVLATVSEY